MSGKPRSTEFDGHGGCFIESGAGRAAYGAGNFYADPAPSSSSIRSVVLTDVPLEGLTVAAARIRAEHLDERAWCVNASAGDLPFRAAVFDAVVHTDVLC